MTNQWSIFFPAVIIYASQTLETSCTLSVCIPLNFIEHKRNIFIHKYFIDMEKEKWEKFLCDLVLSEQQKNIFIILQV